MAVDNSQEIFFIPIKSVNLDNWVMLKSFEVIFSKKRCNIWSEIVAAEWKKIPLIPNSNKSVVIHWSINDTLNPEKRIEGPLEVNQPIEIELKQVRKEALQLLVPNTHSYEKNNKGLTEQESKIYKLNNILCCHLYCSKANTRNQRMVLWPKYNYNCVTWPWPVPEILQTHKFNGKHEVTVYSKILRTSSYIWTCLHNRKS